MTKLTELWKNRKQILEGITNSIIRDEFVESVAEERMSICNTCVRKDDKGDTCLVSGTQPCCNLCGCSLHFKVRSLSTHCPDYRWNKVLTEKEEDKLNDLH
jgi:hypothetical protein